MLQSFTSKTRTEEQIKVKKALSKKLGLDTVHDINLYELDAHNMMQVKFEGHNIGPHRICSKFVKYASTFGPVYGKYRKYPSLKTSPNTLSHWKTYIFEIPISSYDQMLNIINKGLDL